jgi:hypothetical protein
MHVCGMPKNPFLTPPQSQSDHWTQKQANPFLRRGNNCSNSNNNSHGNEKNNKINMFLGGPTTATTATATAMDVSKPISFEEAFPSLTPSADRKTSPGDLNFKLAVQKNVSVPVSTGSKGSTSSSTTTGSSTSSSTGSKGSTVYTGSTGRISNNMFLNPQLRNGWDADAYDYAGVDAEDQEYHDAYDSAYTRYYNDN